MSKLIFQHSKSSSLLVTGENNPFKSVLMKREGPLSHGYKLHSTVEINTDRFIDWLTYLKSNNVDVSQITCTTDSGQKNGNIIINQNNMRNFFNAKQQVLEETNEKLECLSQIQRWHQSAKEKYGSICEPMKEIFTTEVNFVSDMKRLKKALGVVVKIARNNDKPDITQYIEQLNRYVEAYSDLNFLEVLSFEHIDKALEALQRKFQSRLFQTCIDTLPILVLHMDAVTKAYQNQKHALSSNVEFIEALNTGTTSYQDITQLISAPFQRIMRYQMPVEALKKEMTKWINKQSTAENSPWYEEIQSGLEHVVSLNNFLAESAQNAQKQTSSLSAGKVALEEMKHNKKQPLSMIGPILSLNLNVEGLQKEDDDRVKGFDGYLKAILLNKYPDFFESYTINDIAPKISFLGTLKAESICQAFGSEPPSNVLLLNPAQFNVDILRNLYDSDHNLLWLTLISVKPIDERFTRLDKLQALTQVALALIQQSVVIQNKSDLIRHIAHSVSFIADNDLVCQEYVAREWGNGSDLSQWIAPYLKKNTAVVQSFTVQQLKESETDDTTVVSDGETVISDDSRIDMPDEEEHELFVKEAQDFLFSVYQNTLSSIETQYNNLVIAANLKREQLGLNNKNLEDCNQSILSCNTGKIELKQDHDDLCGTLSTKNNELIQLRVQNTFLRRFIDFILRRPSISEKIAEVEAKIATMNTLIVTVNDGYCNFEEMRQVFESNKNTLESERVTIIRELSDLEKQLSSCMNDKNDVESAYIEQQRQYSSLLFDHIEQTIALKNNEEVSAKINEFKLKIQTLAASSRAVDQHVSYGKTNN